MNEWRNVCWHVFIIRDLTGGALSWSKCLNVTSISHNIRVDFEVCQERNVEDLSGLMDGIAEAGEILRDLIAKMGKSQPKQEVNGHFAQVSLGYY